MFTPYVIDITKSPPRVLFLNLHLNASSSIEYELMWRLLVIICVLH